MIGVLNEGPLHATLKRLYLQPGDRVEVPVDGYLVDILRGDRIIEIQTSGFSSIARKLRDLSRRHRVRLVHPIAAERYIVTLAGDGRPVRRRKSPKGLGAEGLFEPLVAFPELMGHESFELEVLITREEELRRVDARRRRRRRGWVVQERRLIEIVERRLFRSPAELAELLPAGLASTFGTAELGVALGRRRSLAQKMVYCLSRCHVLTSVGKVGNAILYRRAATG